MNRDVSESENESSGLSYQTTDSEAESGVSDVASFCKASIETKDEDMLPQEKRIQAY